VRFENVWYAYPSNPDTPVLRGIDLTVKKGQMVALVGANGSGKTTLVSLLMRFFEPTRGHIYIDDVDIATCSIRSLRSQIGLVTQETVIFSDTVRFNIAYGANGVSDEDVQRVARTAHADEFIQALRLTHNDAVTAGYDAQVNARKLSGGQRQRLAIARAVLRDPPIFVLDEATSQVDADSERKIQEALDEITEGRTTFVIAHRFSTIQRANMIVVLDRGKIVGQGAHDDLMHSCPRYVALYQTQFASAE
jgi:ABC-type multidrug transport system fused ATPase/permease subunit